MKKCLLSLVAAGVLFVSHGTTLAADCQAMPVSRSQRNWTEPSRSR